MDALERFLSQFGPVSREAKCFVKSNFEILTTPDKIAKPKRRPMVRPEGFVQPKPKKVKKVQQDSDRW